MKKGDVVTIRDSSYTRSVVNGKLIEEWLAFDKEKGKQYVVVETNCKFPHNDYCRPKDEFNNTVIQAIDSGKVVFIEERFLKLVLPKHKVMIDMVSYCGCATGMICEISDKLYKEIKRES